MKNKILKFKTSFLAILGFGIITLNSCTKNYQDINTDPYGITNQELSADFKLLGDPLKQVQLSIYYATPAWNTQLQQNLIGDAYSGYMCPPTPFANNKNNMTYNLINGWNTYAWDDAYSGVMAPSQSVLKNAGTKYPTFSAWAKILRVEGMHRVSDIYGPIIYTKYGQVNADGSVSYDAQKDVYNAFFVDLDSAVATLTPLVNEATTPIKNFDLVYGGNYKKWVQFANTLRLRLAIRISNIDPAKAKTEGEKALAHTVGLLVDNTDNFLIDLSPNNHPLNTMSASWNDSRMGAPMQSYLNGYNDPRISKYFLIAEDTVVRGKYQGVRQGIKIDAKDRYKNYSALASLPNKAQMMTAAEAWFLKAEAALLGWANAGTIETNYNKGITTSFAQYGLDAATYITNTTATPAPYTDPKSEVANENNVSVGSPYLSTITIKWDNAASTAQKLERIITQKWIAMFPDGQEAWSEFRRTLYPKLFPVVVNESAGKISTSKFIRRINFASSETGTNPKGVEQAITLLGGADNGGTRLWWDTNPQ